jgi:hypothetical protein
MARHAALVDHTLKCHQNGVVACWSFMISLVRKEILARDERGLGHCQIRLEP